MSRLLALPVARPRQPGFRVPDRGRAVQRAGADHARHGRRQRALLHARGEGEAVRGRGHSRRRRAPFQLYSQQLPHDTDAQQVCFGGQLFGRALLRVAVAERSF